jgi:hypothetical protein
MAARQLLAVRHHDLLIAGSVSPAASRPLPVIETRPADGQRRRDQHGREVPRYHLSCLAVNRTTARSPRRFSGYPGEKDPSGLR